LPPSHKSPAATTTKIIITVKTPLPPLFHKTALSNSSNRETTKEAPDNQLTWTIVPKLMKLCFIIMDNVYPEFYGTGEALSKAIKD